MRFVNLIILAAIVLPDVGGLPSLVSMDHYPKDGDMIKAIFSGTKNVICKTEAVVGDCKTCTHQICSDGKTDWASNIWDCNAMSCVSQQIGDHDGSKWKTEDLNKAFSK